MNPLGQSSPARLLHPGELALQGQLAKADAAKPKLANIGSRPAAKAATIPFLHPIFRSSLGLYNLGNLSHLFEL